jgi:anti-anti-sigma factor
MAASTPGHHVSGWLQTTIVVYGNYRSGPIIERSTLAAQGGRREKWTGAGRKPVMFSARVAHEDAATVIELAGDVGYETREAVNAAVMNALAVPAPKLVVDLQAVDYIDSIGVETAIASPARAANSLSMAFCVEPSATVRHILVEMGLDDLLQRAHDPDG